MAGPVWLISNGFHTSVVLRTRDFPLARSLPGMPGSDLLVFGWGADEFYRGHANAISLFTAIFGLDSSLLHVVPVQGSLLARFPHSDVVELRLSSAHLRHLAQQLDASFRRDAQGRVAPSGRGYYPESRFFVGQEHFYFPKMCNLWIAQKLRREQVPLCVPVAVTADNLIWQAAKAGRQLQWRQKPVDAF